MLLHMLFGIRLWWVESFEKKAPCSAIGMENLVEIVEKATQGSLLRSLFIPWKRPLRIMSIGGKKIYQAFCTRFHLEIRSRCI